MFSTHHKINLKFSVTFILLSANAVDLDRSKYLLFGKQLNFDKFRKRSCGKDLSFITQSQASTFNDLEGGGLSKRDGKMRKCRYPAFSPFSKGFLSLPKQIKIY